MERINETMKRVVNAPSFAKRYEEMKNEVLSDEGVQQFLEQHASDVDKSLVDKSLGKLYEYVSQQHDCSQCASVSTCVNHLNGFWPELVLEREFIDVEYMPCTNKRLEDERRMVSNRISSMHMPKDVLSAKLSTVLFDHESRVEIGAAAHEFIETIKQSEELPAKGFYIHGEFGVGKSYVLGAIANELAEIGIRTVLVYVPEFLRELKNSIQDQSLQEKVDFVKKAPVLMLDDLGAENLSSWTRDEILGTIFHYRMAENLPTFISSNFNYDGLEHHFAHIGKGENDVVKAARLMERIRTMTTDYQLFGKNRRL